MVIPAPVTSSPMRVENEWIDYNGHFNMAYYNVLFDRAADEVFEMLGLGPNYVRQTNCSFFTLETHITYLHELHALDIVLIETQLLDCDAKRVHYVQRMIHEKSARESCVLEVIVSHVDLATKKASNFPSDVLGKIEAMRKVHKALPVPAQVGHRIGIRRKV